MKGHEVERCWVTPQLSWTAAIYGAEDAFLGQYMTKIREYCREQRKSQNTEVLK